MGGNVLGDYGACGHCGPGPDTHRGDTHGAGADRCALVDGDSYGLPVGGGLERAVGVDGPGEVIVGQRDRWTDEHPVGQAGRFVDEGVVLHLAAVPHDDALTDVGATPDDAVPPEDGVDGVALLLSDDRFGCWDELA